MRSEGGLGHHVALVLLAALAVTACAPTALTTAPPEEIRPIVLPERGGDEMLKVMSQLKDGNLRQAEAHLEEIIKVRPDIPEAYFNLGWVKHQLNKQEEAIGHLLSGLRLRPEEMGARYLIALSHRELGQFAEAEAVYRKALEMAPDNDKTHFNLGILYELYLFKPQAALEHYRRYQALQAWPDKKVAGWIAVLERQEAK